MAAMDFAIDLKVALSVVLLLVGAAALWAWARPNQPQPVAPDLLLSIFAHAPVAVLWLDGAGELQMANTHARALLGLDPTASRLPATEWQSRLLEDVQAVLAGPPGT